MINHRNNLNNNFIIFIIFYLILTMNAFSQETDVSDSIDNVKTRDINLSLFIGYDGLSSGSLKDYNMEISPFFFLDMGYLINKSLEVGLSLGVDEIRFQDVQFNTNIKHNTITTSFQVKYYFNISDNKKFFISGRMGNIISHSHVYTYFMDNTYVEKFFEPRIFGGLSVGYVLDNFIFSLDYKRYILNNTQIINSADTILENQTYHRKLSINKFGFAIGYMMNKPLNRIINK